MKHMNNKRNNLKIIAAAVILIILMMSVPITINISNSQSPDDEETPDQPEILNLDDNTQEADVRYGTDNTEDESEEDSDPSEDEVTEEEPEDETTEELDPEPLDTGQCFGDIDGDGLVNLNDFNFISVAWKTSEGDPNWNPLCDFNNDGTIDDRDFNIFLAYYGECKPCLDYRSDYADFNRDVSTKAVVYGALPKSERWDDQFDLDGDGDVDIRDFYIFKAFYD